MANVDAQDRLLSWGALLYTYTDQGTLMTRTDTSAEPDATTTYTNDAFGQLRRVILPDATVIDYAVDALGRRVSRSVDGVLTHRYFWSGSRLVAEEDVANDLTNRYIYATRGYVPDLMERAGVFYRIITDHLGSVRLVVEASTRTIAEEVGYDAYGQILASHNLGFVAFGFAGGLYDPDTGLVRFGARAGLAPKL